MPRHSTVAMLGGRIAGTCVATGATFNSKPKGLIVLLRPDDASAMAWRMTKFGAVLSGVLESLALLRMIVLLLVATANRLAMSDIH